MKKRIVAQAVIFAVVIWILLVIFDKPARVCPPETWVGRWEGRCGMLGVEGPLSDLDVNIEIAEDGTVGGRIGGAELTDAVYLRNCMLQCWFGKSKHLIRAGLRGFPFEDSDITDKSVTFILPRIPGEEYGWSFHSWTLNDLGIPAFRSNIFKMLRRDLETDPAAARRASPAQDSSSAPQERAGSDGSLQTDG